MNQKTTTYNNQKGAPEKTATTPKFVTGKLYVKASEVWALDSTNLEFSIVYVKDTSFKVKLTDLVILEIES
jgi:hypothetical protein